MITFEDYQKLDIRVGKILTVEKIPDAKYTIHKLTITFGEELGKRQSCARLINYKDEELVGKNVLCVVNLPRKQIGKNFSEVLTLGLPDSKGECVLVTPDKDIPLGGRLY